MDFPTAAPAVPQDGAPPAGPPGVALCPALEILDADDQDRNVTGQVLRRMVGEGIHLKVRGVQGNATDIQWHVPRTTVKTYTMELSRTTKEDLSERDLKQSFVGFRWIDQGIRPGPQPPFLDSDRPSVPLEKSFSLYSVVESFRIYLMFRPSKAGAIWVTIGTLSWGWRGVAVSSDSGTTWQGSGSHEKDNPHGGPSSELPEWSDRATFDDPNNLHPPWA